MPRKLKSELKPKNKLVKNPIKHCEKPVDRLVTRSNILNEDIEKFSTDDWMDETLEEWKSLGLI